MVLVKIECQPHVATKSGAPPNTEEFVIISMGDYYDCKVSGLKGWNIIHNLIQNGFHCSSWNVTHWRPIELT